jgi:hypothetical protein
MTEEINMKKTATWAVAVLLIMPILLSACSLAPPESTLTVLNPQGPVKKNLDLAPRLDTLNGKKLAMWLSATQDQLFAGKGAELYDELEKMFREKFPDTEIVPYSDLPMKYMPADEVVAAIKKSEPDAVVAGFGG